MWQVYAMVARDLLEDRRREAEAKRRQHVELMPRRSQLGLFRRLISGRDEG